MAAPSAPEQAPEAAGTGAREGYRALLTGSRDMRRDHAIARDAWFSALRVERKSDLLCRWIQLDSMGLAALQRDKAGKTLKGTWGFWPSDRGEGEWQLTRD